MTKAQKRRLFFIISLILVCVFIESCQWLNPKANMEIRVTELNNPERWALRVRGGKTGDTLMDFENLANYPQYLKEKSFVVPISMEVGITYVELEDLQLRDSIGEVDSCACLKEETNLEFWYGDKKEWEMPRNIYYAIGGVAVEVGRRIRRGASRLRDGRNVGWGLEAKDNSFLTTTRSYTYTLYGGPCTDCFIILDSLVNGTAISTTVDSGLRLIPGCVDNTIDLDSCTNSPELINYLDSIALADLNLQIPFNWSGYKFFQFIWDTTEFDLYGNVRSPEDAYLIEITEDYLTAQIKCANGSLGNLRQFSIYPFTDYQVINQRLDPLSIGVRKRYQNRHKVKFKKFTSYVLVFKDNVDIEVSSVRMSSPFCPEKSDMEMELLQ